MAVDFKLKWSDPGRNTDENGGQTTEVWTAYGAITKEDVEASPDFPVRINTPHSQVISGGKAAELCKSFETRPAGYRLFTVTAQFAEPTQNGSFGNASDPLNEPLRLSWRPITHVVEVDVDLKGNAIVNSARQAFANGPTVERQSIELTVRRNEKSFNNKLALKYQNCVNAKEFFGGDPGSVMCHYFAPPDDFTLKDKYVPVNYVFEFRDMDVWGPHPFQARCLDQGTYAYRQNTQGSTIVRGFAPIKVKAASGPAQIVSREVLLNGKGKPIDTDTYTTDGTFLDTLRPPGSIVANYPGAVYFFYLVCPERDFAELGLK